MFKSPKITAFALLLNTLILTNNAFASECYEPSPNLANLGDKYYDFDLIKTFSGQEKDKLNRLFKSLSGKWEGKSIIVDCFGPDNAAEKRLKNTTIKAKNNLKSNTSLEIQLSQKIIEDRSNKSEVITLLDPTNIFEFDFLSDNHLIFSEKYRRGNIVKTDAKKNKIKSSRLIEIIYEIKLENNTFNLTRSYYTNGVYTGEEAWSLRAH